VSLREKLRAKPPRTVVHPLVLEDTTAQEAALQRVRWERVAAEMQQPAGGKPSRRLTAARKAEAAALAALAACAEPLTIRALLPADWEALVASHPPGEGVDTEWDEVTFRAGAVAACVDGDMTADDWAEFFGSPRCTVGERDTLWLLVLRLNLRAPELTQLPKDWPATTS
jgi:hypothetical protein